MSKRLILLFLITISLLFINQSRKIPPVSRNVFPEPTLTPTPMEIPIYPTIINHGSRLQKKISLTFDADMTPAMLEKLKSGAVKSYFNQNVINILIEQKIPATLFLTALWATEYPEVSYNLSKNPLFEIGNHSYSHPAFSKPCFNLPPINQEQKEGEFWQSQEIFKEITGEKPKLFRFPGGCHLKPDLNLAHKYNLNVIGWDVDSRDAFNSDEQIIIKKVLAEVKSGSIVLFHLHDDKDAPKTAEALPTIINLLRQQSYTFVKVSDLLTDSEFNL